MLNGARAAFLAARRVTWFTDERRRSWRFRRAHISQSKDAMLSNISPERLDALLVAAAAVTTAIVAFAMIWIALFVDRKSVV